MGIEINSRNLFTHIFMGMRNILHIAVRAAPSSFILGIGHVTVRTFIFASANFTHAIIKVLRDVGSGFHVTTNSTSHGVSVGIPCSHGSGAMTTVTASTLSAIGAVVCLVIRLTTHLAFRMVDIFSLPLLSLCKRSDTARNRSVGRSHCLTATRANCCMLCVKVQLTPLSNGGVVANLAADTGTGSSALEIMGLIQDNILLTVIAILGMQAISLCPFAVSMGAGCSTDTLAGGVAGCEIMVFTGILQFLTAITVYIVILAAIFVENLGAFVSADLVTAGHGTAALIVILVVFVLLVVTDLTADFMLAVVQSSDFQIIGNSRMICTGLAALITDCITFAAIDVPLVRSQFLLADSAGHLMEGVVIVSIIFLFILGMLALIFANLAHPLSIFIHKLLVVTGLFGSFLAAVITGSSMGKFISRIGNEDVLTLVLAHITDVVTIVAVAFMLIHDLLAKLTGHSVVRGSIKGVAVSLRTMEANILTDRAHHFAFCILHKAMGCKTIWDIEFAEVTHCRVSLWALGIIVVYRAVGTLICAIVADIVIAKDVSGITLANAAVLTLQIVVLGVAALDRFVLYAMGTSIVALGAHFRSACNHAEAMLCGFHLRHAAVITLERMIFIGLFVGLLIRRMGTSQVASTGIGLRGMTIKVMVLSQVDPVTAIMAHVIMVFGLIAYLDTIQQAVGTLLLAAGADIGALIFMFSRIVNQFPASSTGLDTNNGIFRIGSICTVSPVQAVRAGNTTAFRIAEAIHIVVGSRCANAAAVLTQDVMLRGVGAVGTALIAGGMGNLFKGLLADGAVFIVEVHFAQGAGIGHLIVGMDTSHAAVTQALMFRIVQHMGSKLGLVLAADQADLLVHGSIAVGRPVPGLMGAKDAAFADTHMGRIVELVGFQRILALAVGAADIVLGSIVCLRDANASGMVFLSQLGVAAGALDIMAGIGLDISFFVLRMGTIHHTVHVTVDTLIVLKGMRLHDLDILISALGAFTEVDAHADIQVLHIMEHGLQVVTANIAADIVHAAVQLGIGLLSLVRAGLAAGAITIGKIMGDNAEDLTASCAVSLVTLIGIALCLSMGMGRRLRILFAGTTFASAVYIDMIFPAFHHFRTAIAEDTVLGSTNIVAGAMDMRCHIVSVSSAALGASTLREGVAFRGIAGITPLAHDDMGPVSVIAVAVGVRDVGDGRSPLAAVQAVCYTAFCAVVVIAMVSVGAIGVNIAAAVCAAICIAIAKGVLSQTDKSVAVTAVLLMVPGILLIETVIAVTGFMGTGSLFRMDVHGENGKYAHDHYQGHQQCQHSTLHRFSLLIYTRIIVQIITILIFLLPV